jgi:hypothetical protein
MIADDDVDFLFLHDPHRHLGIVAEEALVGFFAQRPTQSAEDQFVVVDEQDARSYLGHVLPPEPRAAPTLSFACRPALAAVGRPPGFGP